MISRSLSAISESSKKSPRHGLAVRLRAPARAAARATGARRRLEQRRKRVRHVALPARRSELREARGERRPELARAREPVVGVLRRRLPHERADAGRKRRLTRARDRRRGSTCAALITSGVGPLEGAPAHQALVEHHARGVDVAPAVLSFVADSLGGGVAILADEQPSGRRAGDRPGGAEIDQLGGAAGREDDVVGADVAVQEADAARWRPRDRACAAAPRRRPAGRAASPGSAGDRRRPRIRRCATRRVRPGTYSIAMK